MGYLILKLAGSDDAFSGYYSGTTCGHCKKTYKQKCPDHSMNDQGYIKKIIPGVLLSHTAARAVPSALKSLTTVFGMKTGKQPFSQPWFVHICGRIIFQSSK